MLHLITKIKNIKAKPTKTISLSLSLIALTIVVASCGGGKAEAGLAELKAKEAELKTQLAELSEQIAKLQGDSGTKFLLVEADKLQPGIFKTYINVQGHVDAEENVSLAAEMPGTITKIHVKPGDAVSKGQVLAETDARALQQSIADLQINADLVNQMFEKQKALWEQKIGTEVQFLQAKAQKESMDKKLAALQEQVRMTKITSPIDGTVDAVDIKLGQLTAPGMPAIRVVNFNNLKLKAELAESYASKVHKGAEVMIKFPDSDDTLTARVSYSSRSISQLNRTFGIEIALDNKKEYHPNQIAVLAINDYKSPASTFSLPVGFIKKDVKGQNYILVAEGNKATRRNITRGKEYNGKIEILEGIGANDLVITKGYEELNEGDAIKIKK